MHNYSYVMHAYIGKPVGQENTFYIDHIRRGQFVMQLISVKFMLIAAIFGEHFASGL